MLDHNYTRKFFNVWLVRASRCIIIRHERDTEVNKRPSNINQRSREKIIVAAYLKCEYMPACHGSNSFNLPINISNNFSFSTHKKNKKK